MWEGNWLHVPNIRRARVFCRSAVAVVLPDVGECRLSGFSTRASEIELQH